MASVGAWLVWRGSQEWEGIPEGLVGGQSVGQPVWVVLVVAEESQEAMVVSGGGQGMAEDLQALLGQVQETSVETGARKDLPAGALEASRVVLALADEFPGLVDSV